MSELFHLCRQFAAFVERERDESEERDDLADLAELQLLTMRFTACALAPDAAKEWNYVDTPELSEERWDRGLIAARFPRLGMYWDLLGRDLLEKSRVGVGDAIDDVESLYSAARDALDELESEGAAEAEENLRLEFRIHSGKHATALIDLIQELLGDWRR